MQDNAFEHFLDEGLITKVIRPIKSGKEASVHLCRANPSTTGETLAALKVFHPPDRRAFRDEGLYRDGEFIKERRIRVAVEKKTTFGKEVAAAIWVDREWEMLGTLFEAGADVPRPLMRSDRALLMTYIGGVAAFAGVVILPFADHRATPGQDAREAVDGRFVEEEVGQIGQRFARRLDDERAAKLLQ